jgi:hypothetical protein
MFVGGFILFGAVIAWWTGFLTTPHGTSIAGGTEHVRTTVVVYLRNIAIATILLSAVAAFLLFPARRPPMPKRDWAIGLLIGLLVASSLYQLFWLQTSVAP